MPVPMLNDTCIPGVIPVIKTTQNSPSKRFPRSAAVRVLTRVLSDHQALDEALSELALEIPSEFRAWLYEVCSGTLRWKGRLDLALDSLSLKKKPSGWLRKILLVAAYQLVVQDRTNPKSVIFETVEEVKAKEGTAPAGFANACLRKLAEHAQTWREMAPQAQEGGASSLPQWLWRKLVAQKGLEWASAYAQASLSRPQLWVRSQAVEKPEGEWSSGGIPGAWQRESRGSVGDDPSFKRGDWVVQDISSQTLISEVSALVRQNSSKLDLTVLDLCAAPGGKSVGLAWNGFKVTATDSSSKRQLLLEETARRAASQIEVKAWNEVVHLDSSDLVWVDAPCSGTGILRRHPDVRWLRTEAEIPALVKTQQELLVLGWEKVRPGGFLVYSVCSVLQEEGMLQIERALNELRFASLIKVWSLFPQNAPHGDGFFAALLKKTN